MKLFVYHTPELVPANSAADCAIAIDVLRATTTIVSALDAGAEAVQVFSDLGELMQTSAAWPPEKRLRAGERGGNRVAGCDLGNSPLDCTPQLMQNKRLFISTTNGTRALQTIQATPIVLAAALINRHAVVQHLISHQPEQVCIVGAGWEGSYALEDTVCAGAILHSIMTQLNCSLDAIAGNDEASAAVALYQHWQDNLVGLLHLAERVAREIGDHAQQARDLVRREPFLAERA